MHGINIKILTVNAASKLFLDNTSMVKGTLIKGTEGGPVTLHEVDSGYNLRIGKDGAIHFKNKDSAIVAFNKALNSSRKAFGHSVDKSRKIGYFTGNK